MAKAPSSARPSVFELFPDQQQPKAVDPVVVVVVEPTPNDILCGQPRTFAAHPGNVRYQEAIAREAVHYCHGARTKQDRMRATRRIVADLQQNHAARFLQLNSAAQWQEVSDAKARDKVSHALREHYKKHHHQHRNPSPSSDESSSEEDEGAAPSTRQQKMATEQEHSHQQQHHHHHRMVSDATFQAAATEATGNDNDHTMRSVDEIRDLLLSLHNSDSIHSYNNINSNSNNNNSNNTITSVDILLDTLRSRDRDEYSSLLLDAPSDGGGSTLRSSDVSQLLQMDIEEWEDVAGTIHTSSAPSAVQVPNGTATAAETAAAAAAAGSRDLQRLFEEPQDDVVMADGTSS